MFDTRPIVKFSVNHPWFVILTALLITIGSVFPALKLEIQPDIESLLPENLDEFYEHVSVDSTSCDKILVMVSGSELLNLENMNLIRTMMSELEAYLPVVQVIDPFSFAALEKAGPRLMVVPAAVDGRVPASEEELEVFRNRLENAEFAKGFVSSAGSDALAIYYIVEKSIHYRETMRGVNEIIEPLRERMNVAVTGTTPFSAETEVFLTDGFAKLLVLVILVILLSYYLGFHSKRAVFLPISLVISGTVFSLGMLSVLGFGLTMVNIVSPPLILTLGSSYSIHVMNSYYHSVAASEAGESKIQLIIDSVSGVSNTVLLASLTTLIGLLSLLFASIPQTREFAVSTAIGVAFSALLSVTLLPAIMSLQTLPKTGRLKKLKRDPLSMFLYRFAPVFVKCLKPALVIIAIVSAIFLWITPHVEFNTSPTKYFPASSPVRQDLTLFTEKIGGYEELVIELDSGEDGFFLEKEVLEKVYGIEQRLLEIENISYMFSFPRYVENASKIMTGEEGNFSSKGLVRYVARLFSVANPESRYANEDYSTIAIQLLVCNKSETMPIDERDTRELMNEITAVLSDELGDDIDWRLKGTSLGFLKLSEMMKRDFFISTLAALIMISIVTSIVFKSFVKGLIALIPLLMGIFSSFILMVLFGIPLDMTTIMVSSITIGVGVDDAIHFLLQHREMQKKYPDDPDCAVRETIIHTGRPIVITTLSIVAGLLLLSFAEFQPIKYFGLLIVFTLFAACFSTIIIMPSVVRAVSARKQVVGNG